MVSAKELLTRMKGDGWSLSEEGVESILEGNNLSFQEASQEILNSDLKDVGAPCLPDDLLKGKKNSLLGPLVLQVAKMRNVSAPKAFEDSGSAPRMLRVSLTDGCITVQGLEVQAIKPLSLRTAPGTKVRLTGKIPVCGGFLLLTPNNISVIGGTVQELYEKWKLSASVSKFSRVVRAADGSGPPPWVPFGEHIVKDHREMQKFKALKDSNSKEKEDTEFENQRKQAVKELAKEGNVKVFGGGKQMLDANVQKVVNAGFSQEVAEWALSDSKNDPTKAIRKLKAAASGRPAVTDRNNYNQEEEDGRRGRGGRGRGKSRGRGRGGGGGGPDNSDDDFEPPPNMPRPSGPASLFDFLDTKMIEKKETINFVAPVPDVRGVSYQSDRGSGYRSRGARGGRGGRGGNMSKGVVNGSVTPPNLTTENWPAPGEDKAPAPSNRTYFESKELMEEKEYQENVRRPPPQIVAAAGREHQSGSYSNDYSGQQSHVRDDGGQKRYGGYHRDTEIRDTGYRQDYKGSQDGNSRDRNVRRGGQASGSYRGGGGSRGRASGYGNSGGYGGGEFGGNMYRNEGGYSGGYRGGRGNSINGYRGDGNSSSNYRVDSNNSSYRYGEGSTGNYWGDGGNYNDHRSDGYRDGNSGGYRENNRGSNNYSNGRYDHYNSRQGNQSGYDQNQGDWSRGGADTRGGRGGNWSAGRGGVGIRASSEYTTKELEMIREFQRSMTLSGHYQQEYDGKSSSHGRYEGSGDYNSTFSGTLEFRRGGRGGGRRGGRGSYY
ncbi:uncharacterized protein [Panulirus ornatus]|uniref:uncharacterized protein n=1 Tax=Panulirus ornatus TaxID=150431 RepID=UPI003A88945E